MKKLAPLSSLPAVYVLVAVILIIIPTSVAHGSKEVRAQGRQLLMLKVHRVRAADTDADAAVAVPRPDGGRQGSSPPPPHPGRQVGPSAPPHCCL
ncbi:unnamed protein product [Urochloa humidicola]